MTAESITSDPLQTDPPTDMSAPESKYIEPFCTELRRARLGIIAAAEVLDATGVIAHARAMRSALYRVSHFKNAEW